MKNTLFPCLATVLLLLNTAQLLGGTADSATYPKNYFRVPLDFPVLLAGDFGEPRRLHFHTGLDIQTKGETGHHVLAAADGYISRINISPGGYGNALYITHPNGYVTVYGHLQSFVAPIAQKVREVQYAKQLFEVDINLPPGEFPVKQGDEIALSGNSGASGGPHLHFEIRDKNEVPLNPLLFGIKITDRIKPLIANVKFYPMDSLKYCSPGYRSKVVLKDGKYQLPGSGVLKLNAATVGFSVNTYDMMEGSPNHLGVYSIMVYDNDSLIYKYEMDGFPFYATRNVLSQVDYPIFLSESDREFHRCYVQPGNSLPVYSHLSNDGLVNLTDGKPHHISTEVSDFSGNISYLQFTLQYDSTATTFKRTQLKYDKVMPYLQENSYTTDDLQLNFPKGCLFDTVYLHCTSALSTASDIYSKVHQVGTGDEESFNWFTIAVKAERLPENLRNKAVLIYQDITGETACRGGGYDNGFIKTRARDFGKYYVMVDSTAPLIRPLNISPLKNMQASKSIQLKITDNMSGIETYNSFIDGKWALTCYDAKNSLFIVNLGKDLTKGEHLYKIEVTDERKNKSQYTVKFRW